MSSLFLTPDDLSHYTGYKPNQIKRMQRFLDNRGIKYEPNSFGFPVVLETEIKKQENKTTQPNLDWIRKKA